MGIEPTTPCLQSRCSSQLSYVPEASLRRRRSPGVWEASQLGGRSMQQIGAGWLLGLAPTYRGDVTRSVIR